MTLRIQFFLQFHSVHAGHMHIADQAISIVDAIRFQKLFGGCELDSCISERSKQTHCRTAERVVIVDNGNHRQFRQLSLLNVPQTSSVLRRKNKVSKSHSSEWITKITLKYIHRTLLCTSNP